MKIKVNAGMTQEQIVLEHLKQNEKGITPYEAFTLYYITRLSGRIFDLRRQGHQISTTTITKHKDGRVHNYALYRLVKSA